MRFPRVPLRWLGLAAAFSLAVAGCSSGRTNGRQFAPQPALFGAGAYFDGAIVAEARLGPFRLHDPEAPFTRTPPAPGEGEAVPVSGGAFGGRTRSEAGAGFPRGPADPGAFADVPVTAGARRGGPAALGAMPRQTMTVTLRSTADTPLVVRVVEVKSALGNFVPVPETFTLAPGGVQALEPMRSAYPEPIDELELLLVLRNRDREESQVLKLTLDGQPAL